MSSKLVAKSMQSAVLGKGWVLSCSCCNPLLQLSCRMAPAFSTMQQVCSDVSHAAAVLLLSACLYRWLLFTQHKQRHKLSGCLAACLRPPGWLTTSQAGKQHWSQLVAYSPARRVTLRPTSKAVGLNAEDDTHSSATLMASTTAIKSRMLADTNSLRPPLTTCGPATALCS